VVKTVGGELVLPGTAPAVPGAHALLRVRDVTLADAPAPVPVSERDLVVDLAPDAHLGFTIDVPDEALDKVAQNKMALNLEVHIDLDGSGSFSRGDLVSLQAQPILADTPGRPLTVPLETV
jgi:hypothetical protein